MSKRVFVIEDEFHAEEMARHRDLPSALAVVKEWSMRPWDDLPNRCSCSSWRTCRRDYVIVEYDIAEQPWAEVSRHRVLSISSKGSIWHEA